MKRINMKATGRNIKQKVQDAGISAQNLADELGYSRKTVYAWYCGVILPRIDGFVMLAQILDCTVDDLLIVGDEE